MANNVATKALRITSLKWTDDFLDDTGASQLPVSCQAGAAVAICLSKYKCSRPT